MPIEITFHQFAGHCQRHRDGLRELRITIAEDRPLRNVVQLVDRLGEVAEDLLGDAEETLAAAVDAEQAVADARWDLAHRAIATGQTRLNRLQERFFTELSCYEVVEELAGLGRKRGGEWRAWAELVGQTLMQCRQLGFETQRAITQCWQELVERGAPAAASPAGRDAGNLVRLNRWDSEQKNAS